MIEKLAWNTFKNTGDINTFLEMKQMEGITLDDKQSIEIKLDGETDGIDKD